MKKIFLLLFVALATTFATETYAANSITTSKQIKKGELSPDQVARLKTLKREIGPKFQAIGRDRSLSGYEKGQRKRALAEQYRSEIRKIVGEGYNYDYSNDPYWGSDSSRPFDYREYKEDRIEDVVDKIERRIDRLENKYEKDIKAIEKNDYMSKAEKKTQKNALKESFKIEKERLKKERDAAKHGYYK